MDDVILEQGHNVPVYTNMSIKWGWIFLVRGEEVINNGKTSKIVGFYAAQNWKKSSNGPPIGPEEMPILVWGRRKRPPTKMGST